MPKADTIAMHSKQLLKQLLHYCSRKRLMWILRTDNIAMHSMQLSLKATKQLLYYCSRKGPM